MIAIAALAAAPGCHKDDPHPGDNHHEGSGNGAPTPPPDTAPPSGGPRGAGQPAPASLADCLKGSRLGGDPAFISDPHGQGSDLLGLGFIDADGKTFVRIDQFDLTTLTSAAGPIANPRIVSHHFEGHAARTSSPLADKDWANAVVTGRLHCSNPQFEHQTYPVKLHVLGLFTKFAAESPQGHGVWTAYQLKLELDDGRSFNACRDKDDVAFPVAGYWDEDGKRNTQDPKLFSFACTQRDVAFCMSQGYRDDQTDERAQLFDACTRMMRADYCGTGESYTHEGTFVTVWDDRNIAERDRIDPFVFEAEWDPKGVMCWARPRWNQPDSGIETPPPCFNDRPKCASAPDAPEPKDGDPPMVLNDSCQTHPCKVIWWEPDHGPHPSPNGREHREDEASYRGTVVVRLPPGAMMVPLGPHPLHPRPTPPRPTPPRPTPPRPTPPRPTAVDPVPPRTPRP